MFPNYCKEFDANDVFGYHGFEKIPAYRKIEVIEPEVEYIASCIKTTNGNSCGFISDQTINYHTCDSESYFINMDNDFVFAYFAYEDYNNNLPLMMIFDFLKCKASRILLVFEDMYFLLEKTPATYKVCEKLDEIYSSHSFMENVFIPAISEKNHVNIFYKIVEIFGSRYLNKDTTKYDILDILMVVLILDIS